MEDTVENDPDAMLNQRDYSAALGNHEIDPQYVKFMTKVQRGGASQVLRYCRWEENGFGSIFFSKASEMKMESECIPCCKFCQSPAKFEFQVRFS